MIKIICFALVLFLTACGSNNGGSFSNSSVCNPDAAYNAGVQDGRNNLPIKTNYQHSCGSDQYELYRAYVEGYRFGSSDVKGSTQ